MTDQTCKERIDEHYSGRIADIRKLWESYCSDNEDGDPELGRFNEYGLCFDYVSPGTFEDQPEGYFRYQLSWGGPSDEFRFYVDEDKSIDNIEYVFMDWFDGATMDVTDEDFDLMEEIFEDFKEMGMVDKLYNDSIDD